MRFHGRYDLFLRSSELHSSFFNLSALRLGEHGQGGEAKVKGMDEYKNQKNDNRHSFHFMHSIGESGAGRNLGVGIRTLLSSHYDQTAHSFSVGQSR